MAAGSEGVSAVVVSGQHRLGGGLEKGDRVNEGVRFGFRRRGVEWIKWVEWIRVEWGRILNPP